MRPKSAVFRGRRWRLSWAPNLGGDYGRCDAPHAKGKTIYIRLGQGQEDELDTLIHEALHACAWDLDEQAITDAASDIARFLRRCGYGKV